MNFQPDTTIYLLDTEMQISNGAQVGFFNNVEEQSSWFMSKMAYKFDNQSYQRLYSGEMLLEINAEVILANHNISYIMYKNSNYSEKWFYANVLSVQYVNPNTTRIMYSVDSWQSFMFDVNLEKPSYIQRRHWSNKNDDENVLMQLPFEDLNLGSDYIYADRTFDENDSFSDFNKDQFYFILTTEPLKDMKSTHIISPQYNTSYVTVENGVSVVKNIDTKNAVNSVLEGYVLNYACLNWMLENDYFQQCVTQNILQQVLLLPFGRSIFPSNLENISQTILGQSVPNAEIYLQTNFGGMSQEKEIVGWCSYLNDYINRCLSGDFNFEDGIVHSELPDSAIGKYLYRYPYSLLEVYDFQNQPTTIQIEQLNRFAQYKPLRDNILELVKYASVGVSPTMTHSIKGYRNSGYRPEQQNNIDKLHSIANEMNVNMQTLNSMLSLPVESDYLMAFLQSNTNQIAASKMNALKSLQTSVNNSGTSLQAGQTAIALGYQTATVQANTALTNAKISANTQMANAVASQVGNVIGSIGGGAIGGGLAGGLIGMGAGAVAGAFSGGVSAVTAMNVADNNYAAALNMANNNISASYTSAANSAKAAESQLQAGYSNSLRSANMSYENTIRALNARIQDASNVPDSVQTQGNGGSYFNTLMNRDCILLSSKCINKEPMRELIDYFCRYGFLTNRSESIKSILDKFKNEAGCYIKTVNACVTGSIPQENIIEIKNMFDSGVFMFHKNTYLQYDKMKGA
ncbi:MAG: hypothetical protein PHX08_08875 [Lachnospiraceae bacterium]|nr:hypothetical protein [Lachnospiraceae bacterium]